MKAFGRSIIRTGSISAVVAVVAFIGSIGLSAFVLPTVAPVGGNVPAPLHPYPYSQKKLGTLAATKLFSIFGVDQPDGTTNRYFDPSGTSVIEGVLESGAPETGRIVSLSTDAAAPAHIVNVPNNPTHEQDAVNKRYVDIALGNVPNLIISSIRTLPARAWSGGNFIIEVVVTNTGRQPPEGDPILIIQISDGTELECSPFTISASDLDPGESYTYQCIEGPWTAGNHGIQTAIDNANQIAEGDEDDNTMSFTVQVVTKPNLSITSLTTGDLDPPGEYRSVTFYATILNNGNQSLSEVATIQISEGGTNLCSTTISYLALGASQQVSCEYSTGFTLGSHTANAVVDSVNVIDESNETDNTRSKSFTTQPLPDFDIVSIKWTRTWNGWPYYVYESYYTITIKNIGSASSPSTVWRFLKSDNSWWGDTGTVSAISAGGQRALTIATCDPDPSSYCDPYFPLPSYITKFRLDGVTEGNRGNNVCSPLPTSNGSTVSC